MCSICGMIDNNSRPDAKLLTLMGATMKNRGPDATEQYSDDFACIHHNRLAVMDIENGRQKL